MTTAEILKLVQAGDLDGATLAIKELLSQKSQAIQVEAKAFIAQSMFESEEDDEEDEGEGKSEEDGEGEDCPR